MTKSATITVSCPCGTSFSREIKRGRPQKWCGPCMATPHAARITMPVVTLVETVIDAEGSERVVNQWDQHDVIRAQIEANVAEVYAGWPAIAARMRLDGASNWDVSHAQADALRSAYSRAGVR